MFSVGGVSISQAWLQEIRIRTKVGRQGVLWFGIDGSWNYQCLLSLCNHPEELFMFVHFFTLLTVI